MTELRVANPWGGTCWYTPETFSTMDDARDLEARGEPGGSLVVAGYQSQGVGRHQGRNWLSAPGDSLLFTVFWPASLFAVPTFAPSLVVGLGVCRWLQGLAWAASPQIALKWPNDVYLDGRKVAGILVRSRLSSTGPHSYHAGVGINLRQQHFAGEFRQQPTSLALHGVSLSPEVALGELLPHLQAALALVDPKTACEGLLWRRGEVLSVQVPDTGSTVVEGAVLGLDAAGGLRVATSAGEVVVNSGE